jgi:hypothetical protein
VSNRLTKFSLFLIIYSLVFSIVFSEAKKKEPAFVVINGLAIGGYDVVAYFSIGKPVKGSSKFELEWQSVKWRFSNAKNRDEFVKSPQNYIPEFGGYCAFSVSQGYLAKGDPNAWAIHHGKLYLIYDKNVREEWIANKSRFIPLGEANWLGIKP